MSTKKRIVSCSHIRNGLAPTDVRKTLRAAIKMLKPIASQFDAIAFCGMSGAVLAPLIALRLNKHLIVVRKPDAGKEKHELRTHSAHEVEGLVSTRRYLIVDDLVCSGTTCRYIEQSIRDWQTNYGVVSGACHGGYLYMYDQFVETSRWRLQSQSESSF